MKNDTARTFIHDDYGILRAVMIEGRPWFVACDVARSLGYSHSTSAIRCHVPDSERTHVVLGNARSYHRMNAISLAGLCCLTTRCGRPGAKEYASWVKTEVLPVLLGTCSRTGDPHEEEAEAWKKALAKKRESQQPPAREPAAPDKAGTHDRPAGKTPAETSPEDDGDGFCGGLLIIIVEEI